MFLIKAFHIIADASPEAKGFAGFIASCSLNGVCAASVAFCTCVYLLRKTYLLQPATPKATDNN